MSRKLENAVIKAEMMVIEPIHLTKPVLEEWLRLPSDLRLVKRSIFRSLPPEPVIAWRSPSHPDKPATVVKNNLNHCLWEFIALHDASDQTVLDFVSRYGPLGLWPFIVEGEADGEPLSHMFKPETDALWLGETVRMWRRLSGNARALLLVASKLLKGEMPVDEHWHRMMETNYGDPPASSPGPPPEEPPSVADWPIERLRELFAFALYRWSENVTLKYMPRWPSPTNTGHLYPAKPGDTSGLQVRLTIADMPWASWTLEDYQKSTEEHWAEYGLVSTPGPWFLPQIHTIHRRTRPSHLFNLLVTQMIAAVTSSSGIYECSICGKPFPIKYRRPQNRQGPDGAQRMKLCGEDPCKQAAARKRAAKSYDSTRKKQ